MHLLNLFIGFLQPQDDMESNDGPQLPIYGGQEDEPEFQPFIRRVPEFKFWYVQLNLLNKCSHIRINNNL